jgi:hypothetical protein
MRCVEWELHGIDPELLGRHPFLGLDCPLVLGDITPELVFYKM